LGILTELEVDPKGTIDKSQFFEIYVRLGLLKPISLLTSEYLARENIRIFDKICAKLATEENQEIYEVETVRQVFFNLNYLWGDWLDPNKLNKGMARPERMKTKSPMKKEANKKDEGLADLPEEQTQ